MAEQVVTKHWVVSYINPEGDFGLISLHLDKPHGLLASDWLWGEALSLVRDQTGNSRTLVLGMTPSTEKVEPHHRESYSKLS